MSFADWHSGVAVSSRKQPSNLVCMSTVDDLSYTPSAEEQTRDAAQIVATGRRSWKTLKGKGEAVWPPLLEAALIEALEKYQPDDSRTANFLGRFPMRNRFISDYIFEVTGKRRTPKQVGSRLQQLRDTCKGKRILHLISRRGRSTKEPDSPSESPSTTPEPTRVASMTPPPGVSKFAQSNPHPVASLQRTALWVDILLDSTSWLSPMPTTTPIPIIDLENSTRPSPLGIHLSPLPVASYEAILNASPTHPSPQSLSATNPTLSFASSYALSHHCSFYVFVDDAQPPVHVETASLECLSDPTSGAGWLYSTTLVPGFWNILCNSTYPTRYTILQNLMPISQSATLESDDGGLTTTIVYHFNHSDTTATFPSSPCDTVYAPSSLGFRSDEARPYESPTRLHTYHWTDTSLSNISDSAYQQAVSTFQQSNNPVLPPACDTIPRIMHGYVSSLPMISKCGRYKMAANGYSIEKAAQSEPLEESSWPINPSGVQSFPPLYYPSTQFQFLS